jgi:peptidoglycan/LPS O-acetylase OafA/YrhL
LPLLLLTVDILILKSVSVIFGTPVCENNSFAYFSFINQLPAFAVGFVLYDCIKYGLRCNRLLVGISGGVAMGISLWLFQLNMEYSFVLIPFLFACGFAGCYWCLYDKGFPYGQKIFQLVKYYGRHSFAIYLTHSFIVYDCIWVLKKTVEHFGRDFNSYRQLLFPCLLPLILIGCLGLALVFEKLVGGGLKFLDLDEVLDAESKQISKRLTTYALPKYV